MDPSPIMFQRLLQIQNSLTPLQIITPIRTRYQYIRHRTRVKRDMARHQMVADAEIQRGVLKALHRDHRLDMKTRLRAMLNLHSMPAYTRKTELKPRCVETGRGGGMIQPWRVSRIVFREAAINGRLSGVIRAQW